QPGLDDLGDLAIGPRDGGRAAHADILVQQRHLADDAARADALVDKVADPDLDRAGAHDEHAVARLVDGEDRLSGGKLPERFASVEKPVKVQHCLDASMAAGSLPDWQARMIPKRRRSCVIRVSPPSPRSRFVAAAPLQL